MFKDTISNSYWVTSVLLVIWFANIFRGD